MARALEIDWDKVRLEFIADPRKDLTVSQYLRDKKMLSVTNKNRATRERWIFHRDNHWQTVTRKAQPLLEDMQAVVLARDVASKLTWIDELRQLGLELARAITVKDSQAGYGEIVTAIERVEKLERLILGESTEIIKVDDARAMVQQIVAAAHREVRNDDDRNRFLAALEHLGPAQARSISTLN